MTISSRSNMNIPIHVLKGLYAEMTIHVLVEIVGYDEHGQLSQQVQVIGTHPEIGILSIRQGAESACSYDCEHFEFDESLINSDFEELTPGYTVNDWKRDNPARADEGDFLGRTAVAERQSSEAFLFVREKAKVAGIQAICITSPLYGPPPKVPVQTLG